MTKWVTGVEINYYFICKTKLWLFHHKIQLENESDNVKIGKILHEEKYKNNKKEFLIDDIIKIDFIKKKNNILEIHEIKKSDKIEISDKYQLLYYLYYLKKEKNISNTLGVLNYPLISKTINMNLTKNIENEIEEILKDIDSIISKPILKPKKRKICNKCAYLEFCFS